MKSLILLIWLDAANVLSVPWWAYLIFVLLSGSYSYKATES